MKLHALITSLAITLLACDNDTDQIKLTAGTYQGQFISSSPDTKRAPIDVTLTFFGESFTAESDAIAEDCSGTYQLTGRTIEFKSSCPESNAPNWRAILNGKFKATFTGKKLEMQKTADETSYNYSLTLQ